MDHRDGEGWSDGLIPSNGASSSSSGVITGWTSLISLHLKNIRIYGT
jgi:hypothetical protein